MMNKTNQLIEEYADENQLQLSSQFDDCIVGVLSDHRLVYSAFKIIEVLQQEMSYEDAIEHFYYNIECTTDQDYNGSATKPGYIYDVSEYEKLST